MPREGTAENRRACFCCEDTGHRRQECPLKDKCLICGKTGHVFRDCYLKKNRPQCNSRSILCIFEEDNEHDNNRHCNLMNDDAIHEIVQEDGKNMYQLPATISSVELD